MKIVKQDVDKTVKLVEDVLIVKEDIQNGIKNEKLSWWKILVIVLSHFKKFINFFKNIVEIKDEVLDIDSQEAGLIVDEISKKYNPKNPYVMEGSKKTLQGVAQIKDGLLILVEARKWEKENKNA